MTCPSCGAAVAMENVFPGGTVRCACGAAVTVPREAARVSTAPGAAPAHGPAEGRPSMASASPPSSVPPSTTALDVICPRCDQALVLREDEGLVVTTCPAHHGLFVGRSVLAELTASDQHARHAVAALDDGPAPDAFALRDTAEAPAVLPPLHCPRCRNAMTRGAFARSSPVVVDVCPAHGTWFDAGELRAAAADAAANAGPPDELGTRSAATLDVALALEAARDEETARRGVDLTADLLDTFDSLVLGRSRWEARRSRWR